MKSIAPRKLKYGALVSAHDNTTRGPVMTEQGAADLSSRTQGLETNADGSVDVYLGPTKPVTANKNWIKTTPGKTWQLNDIEAIE